MISGRGSAAALRFKSNVCKTVRYQGCLIAVFPVYRDTAAAGLGVRLTRSDGPGGCAVTLPRLEASCALRPRFSRRLWIRSSVLCRIRRRVLLPDCGAKSKATQAPRAAAARGAMIGRMARIPALPPHSFFFSGIRDLQI